MSIRSRSRTPRSTSGIGPERSGWRWARAIGRAWPVSRHPRPGRIRRILGLIGLRDRARRTGCRPRRAVTSGRGHRDAPVVGRWRPRPPRDAALASGPLPVTTHLAASTIGLPCFRDLERADIDRIVDCVLASVSGPRSQSLTRHGIFCRTDAVAGRRCVFCRNDVDAWRPVSHHRPPTFHRS